jgi:WD40 repeat protein
VGGTAVQHRQCADDSVTGKHIYDLAWSPDSEFLIAGSTDNTASIWKAGTGMSFRSREEVANEKVRSYTLSGNIRIMFRE